MYCFLSTPFIGAVPWPGEMLQHMQKGKNAQLHTHTKSNVHSLYWCTALARGNVATHAPFRKGTMQTHKKCPEKRLNMSSPIIDALSIQFKHIGLSIFSLIVAPKAKQNCLKAGDSRAVRQSFDKGELVLGTTAGFPKPCTEFLVVVFVKLFCLLL